MNRVEIKTAIGQCLAAAQAIGAENGLTAATVEKLFLLLVELRLRNESVEVAA